MTATATLVAATPKKLRNGSWGALANTEHVQAGDTLEITTKAGKTWTATVSKVIWTGNGVAICATTDATTGRTSRRRTRVECRNCGCTDPTCVRNGRCTGGPDFDPCFDCA